MCTSFNANKTPLETMVKVVFKPIMFNFRYTIAEHFLYQNLPNNGFKITFQVQKHGYKHGEKKYFCRFPSSIFSASDSTMFLVACVSNFLNGNNYGYLNFL
jgi:hypothetical protein